MKVRGWRITLRRQEATGQADDGARANGGQRCSIDDQPRGSGVHVEHDRYALNRRPSFLGIVGHVGDHLGGRRVAPTPGSGHDHKHEVLAPRAGHGLHGANRGMCVAGGGGAQYRLNGVDRRIHRQRPTQARGIKIAERGHVLEGRGERVMSLAHFHDGLLAA